MCWECFGLFVIIDLSCSEKTLYKKIKETCAIKRQNNEEIEGNSSTAKSWISQHHGNAHIRIPENEGTSLRE